MGRSGTVFQPTPSFHKRMTRSRRTQEVSANKPNGSVLERLRQLAKSARRECAACYRYSVGRPARSRGRDAATMHTPEKRSSCPVPQTHRRRSVPLLGNTTSSTVPPAWSIGHTRGQLHWPPASRTATPGGRRPRRTIATSSTPKETQVRRLKGGVRPVESRVQSFFYLFSFFVFLKKKSQKKIVFKFHFFASCFFLVSCSVLFLFFFSLFLKNKVLHIRASQR